MPDFSVDARFNQLFRIDLSFGSLQPQQTEPRKHEAERCDERQPGQDLERRHGVIEPYTHVRHDKQKGELESKESIITVGVALAQPVS